MKYVDMNEVVFDSSRLAFPGLGNCHGIVYVNQYGMFGYHAAGNPLSSEGKAEAFGIFVKGHSQGSGESVGLYGLCPTNRHKTDEEHKTELQMIAEAIGFAGKFNVHRWDMEAAGWGTTYVEVNFNQKAIGILIEDFSKGTSTSGANGDYADHKYVTQRVTPSKPKGVARSLAPRDEVTTSISRQSTLSQFVTTRVI